MADEKKKKSNAGIVIVVILIIIILLFVFSSRARANQPKLMTQTNPTPTGSGSGAATTTTTYVTVTDNTILKKGMDNEHVAKLQALINKVNTTYGLPLITVDGDFGSGTEAALVKLTGKKEISYNQAVQMAEAKFKDKGYTESMISAIFNGVTFGLFT